MVSLPQTHELLDIFRAFLSEAGLSKVSVKNYVSDVRKFLEWSTNSSVIPNSIRDQSGSMLNQVQHDNFPTPELISKFVAALQDAQVPHSTTNRYLASLRRYSVFLKLKFNIDVDVTLNSFQGRSRSMLNQVQHDNTKIQDDRTQHDMFGGVTILFLKSLQNEDLSHSTVKNYKSDLNHFLSWSANSAPPSVIPTPHSVIPAKAGIHSDIDSRLRGNDTINDLSDILSPSSIDKYQDHLKIEQTSSSVINRRISTLKKFVKFSLVNKLISSDPFSKLSLVNSQFSNPLAFFKRHVSSSLRRQGSIYIDSRLRGNDGVFAGMTNKIKNNYAYRKYNALPFVPYLHLAILVLFVAVLANFGYDQIVTKSAKSLAYPATPTRPTRQLSFQGRLTDSSDTPITVATDVVFKLYSVLSGGSQLYTSGTCSVTPDQDGIFNTLIGDTTCGAEIDNTVFSENSSVYMEVTVGASTLTPRQQIATVGFALNTETLQGYPVSSTASATRSTVAVMNQYGEVILGEQSPVLKSVSGTFGLQGQTLSLSTAATTNGNVNIAPDGTGSINAIGGATSGNFYRLTDANLTSGNLISGYVGNNTATGNLLSLSSGSSETVRLAVAATGQTTLDAVGKGKSAFIVNQVDSGPIFAASASGTNKFLIANSGDVTVNGGRLTTTNFTMTTTPASNYVLTSDASGNASWQAVGAASIADDTLDFNKFEDTMDLDANLILNQSTYTWVQNFTGTTTTGLTYNADSLTSGTGLALSSTSTTLTSGSLSSVDWSPGSATTATGDLVSINIGTNGNIGNLFNVKDTGSSLFSVSETAVTSNLPTSFTSSGDVSIAYDLNFTNPVASYIKSAAPLYITAGETYNSSDLKLGTYNKGNIVANTEALVVNGSATVSGQTVIGTTTAPANIGGLYLTNAATYGKALAILNQTESADIFAASASGVNKFVITSAGNVGIGTITPGAKLGFVASTTAAGGIDFGGDVSLYRSAANNLKTDDDITFSQKLIATNAWFATEGTNYQGIMSGGNYYFGKTFDSGNSGSLYYDSAGGYFTILNNNSTVDNGVKISDNLTIAGNVVPDATGTRDLGSSSLYWNNLYANNIYAPGTGTSGYWQRNSGAISPANLTDDLLLGTTATSSALFAFKNIASGTPTASISGNSAGRAISIDGLGNITTTAMSPITIGSASTGPIALNPKGSTGLYVDGTGQVGIGTTGPTEKLTITGGNILMTLAGGARQFSITPGLTGTEDITILAERQYTSALKLGTASGTDFVIKGQGNGLGNNVGIGTTGPSTLLHLYSNTATPELRIGSINNSYDPTLSLVDNANPTTSGLKMWYDYSAGSSYFDSLYNNDAGNIYFRTKTSGTPVNAVTILGSGNIGIGTTAPSAKLDLASGNIAAASAGFATGAPTLVSRFDGPKPDETDYTGNPNGNLGQAATVTGGVIHRPGKFGKGVQIAEATTNLVTNPSIETGTTSWSNGNNAPISQDSLEALYGSKSLKVDYTAAGWATYYPSVSISTQYTFSFYAKGSGTVYANFYSVETGDLAGSAVTLSSSWQRVTKTFTTSSTVTSAQIQVRSSDAGAHTVYVDGIQVEAKAYATPYADGSLGNGHSWSGTAHASTSSRTAANLSYADPKVNLRTGTMMGWIKPSWSSSNTPTYAMLGDIYIDGSNEIDIIWKTNHWELEYYVGAVNNIASITTTHSVEDLIFIAATWDTSDRVQIYVNGVAGTPDTSISGTMNGTPTIYPGSRNGGMTTNGVLDDFAIFPSALSAQEIYSIYKSNAPIVTQDQSSVLTAGKILPVSGTTSIAGNLIPTTTNTYDLGSSSIQWNNLYVNNIISGGTTAGFWQRNSGALAPSNLTDDLLLGTTATSSALFAFKNIASGTPTASISGNSAGRALSIDGLGNITTTAMSPITIGSASTGPIALNPKGTTGLYVDGTGQVGIGTTAPVELLHIKNSVAGGTYLRIENAAGNKAAGIKLMEDNAVNGAAVLYDGNPNYFTIQTAEGGTVLTDRLTILRDGGNVGIGTTNPSAELVVDNGSLGANRTPLTVDVTTNYLKLQTSGIGASPGYLVLNPDGNNVGIGTTAPTRPLTLTYSNAETSFANINSYIALLENTDTTANNNALIGFRDTGNYAGAMGLQFTDHTNDYGDLYFVTRGASGFGERVRITGTGNVGIGTTGPDNTLDIVGTLDVSGTTEFGNIAYTWPTSGQSSNYVLATNGSGTLSWNDPNSLAASVIYWNQANGSLFPKNSTVDAFIGGQATASAKFAFLNVNSGTPTASISGTANRSLVLDAFGNITTTAKQSLTLGDSSTGNIILNGGFVGIGTTAPGAKLTVGSGQIFAPQGSASVPAYSFSIAPTSGLYAIDANSVGIVGTGVLAGDFYNGTARWYNNSYFGNTSAITWTPGNPAYSNPDIGLSRGAIGKLYVGNGAVGDYSGTLIADNVGIGTTGPNTKLEVNGAYGELIRSTGSTTSHTAGFGPDNSRSGYAAQIFVDGTAQAAFGNTGLVLGTYVAGANYPPSGGAIISGNVGIGDTTPTEGKLVVGGRTYTTDFTMTNGGTSNYVLTSDASGNASWAAVGAASIADDSLDFAKFEDTMDLDANLILNQSTYTWVQNFTGTTTTGLTYNANSLTSGTGLALSSTSTALTTGGLLSTDWSPGSSTTATGDLVSINIGTNGTVGNLFNVLDTGSSLFSVSETAVTSNLPTSFTSSGDVSIAYDLNFTNPTASYIKSLAPLYITSGETFNSSDLNLTTFNKGNVIINSEALSVVGSATISGNLTFNQASIINTTTGTLSINTTNNQAITTGTGVTTLGGNLVLNNSAATTTFGGIAYTWPSSQNSNYILATNGSGTLSWVDPNAAAASVIYWNQANGSLFPKNSTVDAFIGGQATASAKFAFLNVNSGTPTASISGNSAGRAISIDGLGNITTTAMSPITIGSASTGPIALNPKGTTGLYVDGTGQVGIGTTAPGKKLDVVGTGKFSETLTLDTSSVATNPHLLFNTEGGVADIKMSSAGDFRFVNAAYTTVNLRISDAGVITSLSNINSGGTLTSAGVLAVNGTGYSTISGPIDIGVSNTQATEIGGASGYGYIKAYNTTGGAYANLVLNSGGGNVGIGDTTPASALTVGSGDLFQVNSTGNIVKINNVTTSFPASQGAANTILTNDGAGTLTWATIGAASIADDSLDFTKFEDTMDLDANLILNQSTYTWVQNFTGTTTAGLTYNANSLTSGTGLALSSTSTALTSGSLSTVDWSPGSATTATGDLVSINIGTNGNIGNLFNVKDTGSSLFSVSETAVTSNLPTSFTSSGDVSIAYDLNFTNPVASYIKSAAPLYITAGETYNSSDLKFGTYNKGNIVANTEALVVNGAATVSGILTAQKGIFNQTETQDIFAASASGVNKFVITNAGNVGIGTAAPTVALDIYGKTKINNDGAIAWGGAADYGYITWDTGKAIVKGLSGKSLSFGANGAVDQMWLDATTGSVGIGTTGPAYKLDVSGGSGIVGQFSGRVIGGNAVGSNEFATLSQVTSGVGPWSRTSPYVYLTTGSDNVGIGTTGPLAKLSLVDTGNTGYFSHFYRSASESDLVIGAAQNYQAGVSNVFLAGSGFEFFVNKSPSTTSLSGGTRAMLIDSSGNVGIGYAPVGTGKLTINGNVGIGTTGPSALLHLKGQNTAARGQLTIEATDYTQVTMFNGASTATSLWQHDIANNITYFGTGAGGGGQLQFVTGTQANAVRIDSSGNVGIGTTGPEKLLHLKLVASGLSYPLKLQSTGDASGDGPGILFAGGSDVNRGKGAIGYRQDASGYNRGDLIFYNDAVADTNNVGAGDEVMVIKNNGNVGIGTTAPSAKLHVAGDMRLTGALYDVNNGVGTSGQVLSSTVTGTDWVDISSIGIGGSGTTNYLPKFTAGTTLGNSVVYETSGNVGIGTTGPGFKTVIAPASSSDGLSIYQGNQALAFNADGNIGAWIAGGITPDNVKRSNVTTGDGAGRLIMQGSLYEGFQFQTAIMAASGANTWATKMVIKNDGNVGIGTVSPGAKLAVDTSVLIGRPGGTGPGDAVLYLGPYTNATTYAGSLRYNDVTTNMDITPRSGSNVIFTAGNVGIGTTGPTNKLHIYTAAADNYTVSETGGAGNTASFGAVGTGGAGYLSYTGPSGAAAWANRAQVIADGNTGGLDLRMDATAGYLRIYTGGNAAGNERVRIDSSGNVGIGTTVPLAKLQVGSPTGTITSGTRVAGTILAGSDQSATVNTVLRLTRGNDGAGHYYSGGADFNIYSYGAGGIGDGYAPKTQLDIALKSSTDDVQTALVNVMSLRDNGNVGIGTTAPSVKLHLASTTDIEQYIERGATTNYAMLTFKTTSGGAYWGIGNRTSAVTPADSFSIYSNVLGANAVTILNSGNVGIGTTAPSAKLELASGNIAAASAGFATGAPTLVSRFDGPKPDETDYTGNPNGNLGQAATVTGGVIHRPGKFGKGVQIAEATTNIIVNPSFETTLGTGWSIDGPNGEIAEIVASHATYGSSAFHLLKTNSGVTARISQSLGTPSNTPYTLSFNYEWVSGTPEVMLYYTTAPYSAITQIVLPHTSGRYSYTFTPTGTQTVGLYLEMNGGGGGTGEAYFDAIQLEQKAYATPYADGSLGNGHSWSGTAHASTSSRTDSHLYLSANGVEPRLPHTLLTWVKSNSDEPSTNPSMYPPVASYGSYYTTNSITLMMTNSNLTLYVKDGANNWNGYAGTSFSKSDGNWHLVGWEYDGTYVYVIIDGQRTQAAVSGNFLTDRNASHSIFVGNRETSGGYMWNGTIDDLAIFPTALSAQEIYSIYKSNAPIQTEDQSSVLTAGKILPVSGATNIAGNFIPTATSTYDLGSSSIYWNNLYANNIYAPGTGVSGYWQRNSGAITPTNISDSLNLGAVATSSALIHLAGTSGENSFINTGNVGIGTTSPSEGLHVYEAGTDTNWYGRAVFGNQNYVALLGTYNDGAVVGAHNAALTAWAPLYINTVPSLGSGGNVIMYGNVGIGTTAPGANLEISKTLNSANTELRLTNLGTGANTGAALSFYDATTVRSQITSNLNDEKMYFYHRGDNRMVIDNSGNVGIGTTGPGARLTIADTNKLVDTRGNLYIYSTDSMAIDKGGELSFGGSYTGTSETVWGGVAGRKENATDANIAGYLAFSTNKAAVGIEERVRITSNGNVGIGTTAPSETLTVKGGISQMSSDDIAQSRKTLLRFQKSAGSNYVRLTVPQNYNSSYNGGGVKVKVTWMADHASGSSYQEYIFSYTTNHGTANYLGLSDVSPTVRQTAASSYYYFDAPPNVQFYKDATNNGVTMEILGYSTYSNQIMVEAEVFGRTVSIPTLTHLGTSAPGGISLMDRTLSIDGNVGIGTTSPTFTLEVNGRAKATSLAINSTITDLFNNSPWYGVGMSNITLPGAGSFATQLAGYYGLNFATGNANSMVINQNGNVGIGTTNPGALLEVAGNAIIGKGSQTSTYITVLSSNSAKNWQLSSNTSVAGNFEFTPSTANGGTTFTTPVLSIQSGGNVGIGTTAPGAKLDIVLSTAERDSVAALNISDGYYPYHFGYAGRTVGGFNFYGQSSEWWIDSQSSIPINLAQGGSPVMTIKAGNVGIGTTGPRGILDVFGDGTKNSYIQSGSIINQIMSVNGNWVVNNLSAGELVRITNAGNVGIGTTGPTNLLFVNQSANATAATVGTYGLAVGTSATASVTMGSDASYAYIQSWLSKPLYLNSQGNNVLINGSVGIGDTTPASALTVGSGDLFQVNSTGNIVKINNVTTSFPASQGAANTILTNDGAGTLTWGTIGAGSISADSLDFTEFQDTLDLDANLILNQSTYTWTQNFTGTTTTGLTYNANSLSSGTALALSSTSTALTSGSLSSVDWSPGSATTATGDLVRINIGTNGTVGNLFNVLDTGSSLFSVSETAVTSNLPTSFTSSGDVSIAYDINFTNPTASYIKSLAPLYLTSGETFNSSDLNLTTYNKGNVILNTEALSVVGSATISGQIKIAGGTPGTNKVLTSDSVGLASWTSITGAGGVGGSGTLNYVTKFTPDGNNIGNSLIYDNGTNVGIGTTGPGYKLEVAGAGYFNNGGFGAIINNAGVYTFGGSYMNTYPTIRGGDATVDTNIGVQGSRAIRFLGASDAEYMRITSTGNVGIGTTSPNAKLDVAGSATISATLSLAPYTAGAAGTCNAAAAGKMYYDGPGNVYYFCNGTTWAQIGGGGSSQWTTAGSDIYYNTGNVGIGTTAPGYKLDINGATNTNGSTVGIKASNAEPALALFDSSQNRSLYLGYSVTNDAGSIFAYGRDGTGAKNIVVQQYGGNVGIGTTSPTQKLDVNGYIAADRLYSRSSSTNMLNMYNGGVSLESYLSYRIQLDNDNNDSTEEFLVDTNGGGTRLFTVRADGNVGIGTTAPASLLSVGSASQFQVNTSGDAFSVFTTLDGSTTANGAGTSSTTLILTSATNFNVGNYVQVSSTNCVTGVNVCYSKITAIATNTLTISPALTWANSSAVVEVHVPELGGIDTSQALANRYGRGYFIDGIVTGNGSSYFTDNLINFGGGSSVKDASGKLQLQAGGSTTGSTGTGSIYFLDNTGVAKGRIETYGESAQQLLLGDGSDGALSVTSGTTTINTVLSGNAYGTIGSTLINMNSTTGIVANDQVLIIQILGSGAGNYENARVDTVNSSTQLKLKKALTYTYSNSGSDRAQVIRVPEYTTVSVSNGATLTAPTWDGTIGGVLVFRASTSVTNDGTITMSTKGFSGGAGGAAGTGLGGGGAPSGGNRGGGGAGYGAAGSAGGNAGGAGGSTYGTSNLSTLFLGSGGSGGGPGAAGSGGSGSCNAPCGYSPGGGGSGGAGGTGGTGGGAIFVSTDTFTNNSTVVSSGNNGSAGSNGGTGGTGTGWDSNAGWQASGGYGGTGGSGGGGGSGGAVLIKAVSYTAGTITTAGASAGGGGSGGAGGAGGCGGNMWYEGCNPQQPSGGGGYSGGAGGVGRNTISTDFSGSSSYGTLYLGSVNTTDADLAEYYTTSDTTIESGDVVSINNNGLGKGELTKAVGESDPKLVGIISTTPGLVLGSIDSQTGNANKRQLALAGRVPVKIDPDSEPIEVGDFLTSSDKPGYAKKATKAGYVLAKALENWISCHPEFISGSILNQVQDDTCDIEKIEVFVHLSYFDPSLELTSTGDLNITMPVASESGKYVLKDMANNIIERIGVFSDAAIANMKVGLVAANKITAKTITIEDLLISPIADIDLLRVKNLIAENATVSGTLIAERLVSPTLDQINSQLSLINSQFSTASSILSSIQAKYTTFGAINNATTSGDPLNTSHLYQENATIADLNVTGAIFANSLNSNSDTLFVQPLGTGSINLLAGLMSLTPDGNVTINGNLNVTGSVLARDITSGKSNVDQLSANKLSLNDLTITTASATESASVGFSTIASSSAEIFIPNSKVSENTLIYVTPIGNTNNQVLYVKEKVDGLGFTVAVPSTPSSDLRFNYWLIKTQ